MRDEALGKKFEVGAYHLGEEIVHAVTHGTGLLLSIVGLIVLVLASLRGDAWHVLASAVFGVTLILVYAASTAYHAVPHLNAKLILRRLDQAAVFLLIAGTYTPFSLGPLRHSWGWLLCSLIWTLALGGILLQNTAPRLARTLSLPAYLAMGWIGLLVFKPLTDTLHPDGIKLLFGGGLAYTVGVGFYAMPVRYAHAVWHVFVLAGSISHFCCVLGYVIPPA